MKHYLRLLTTTLLISLPLAGAVAQEEFHPIPETIDLNKAKVELGEVLYNDKRLSADGTVACATCHVLHKGGVDRLPVSTGIKDQNGPINSPTVYNSAHNFVQFWDGRAANLEEQALGPVENPKEMGDQWPNVVKKIAAVPAYKKAFNILYDGKVTKENIANAIAEFERSLITPGSRFDQYLKGDDNAISEIEKQGFALFQELGCVSCHDGDYFGGNSYQYMSEDYFINRGGEITEADLGRYNVTQDEADKYMFKVPMLRNVAVTPPYFHDGQAKTLGDAVTKMAKYQLGTDLTSQQRNALVAFLKTLTGKYKGVPLDRMPKQN